MTHWIEHYLRAEYEDGARGPDKYDCWGLCREVRHKHYGARLLPSWGDVRHDMPREFTQAYREEAQYMEQCVPEPGAIACVFRGALMLHVAAVIDLDGRLAVLEINPKAGARWRGVRDFEAPYAKVIYYRDRSLS
jgi:hypothetical protein